MKIVNSEVVGEKLVINPVWCKGCGNCTAFCPKNILELKNEKVNIVDEQNCIQCGMCEMRCPDYAIFLRGKKNVKKI